jgi:hypothetical protein
MLKMRSGSDCDPWRRRDGKVLRSAHGNQKIAKRNHLKGTLPNESTREKIQMRKMRYRSPVHQGRGRDFYVLRRRNETAGAEAATVLGLMVSHPQIQIIQSEKPLCFREVQGFPFPVEVWTGNRKRETVFMS